MVCMYLKRILEEKFEILFLTGNFSYYYPLVFAQASIIMHFLI